MPSFALAAQEADRTGMPVVEGFAARAADPAEAVAVETHILALLAVRHPDFSWTATETPGGWRAYRLQSAAVPPPPFPTLGAAWDTVREIAKDPRIVAAEPLLLARLPITSGSDAQREFKLWGTIKDERLQQIERESKALHWSLVKMNVCDDQGAGGAWAAWKAQPGNQNRVPGDGILIAHPDTGYTPHARLVPQLHARPGDPPGHHGRSFVEDTPEALTNGLDPMQDRSMGNQPGHGTHTASVIAAAPGDDGVPWGVAPGAKIIPLRVSSSVIHLSFGNVCSAFAEAIKREAHVISMSLGGPFGSGPLITAVREALDQGIIVVSAAGNHAPTTVFPARVAGVIACAASNVLTAPWRFSGLGSEVAITAPGELVWHDTRSLQGVDGLTSGSGTSYATANVAGLAALWLSFHGRDALAAKYGLPGIPFAFRMCLQESANKQPKFLRQGKGGFGAGVVDAEALLLETLPHQEEVKRVRQEILSQDPSGIVGFPINTWWIILTLPTLAADGAAIPDRQVDLDDRAERINRFLTDLVGPLENLDMAEIAALAASDRALQRAFARVAQGDRTAVSAAAVRRYLLRPGRPLSESLRGRLVTARDAARGQWLKLHPALSPGAAQSVPPPSAGEYPLSPPPTRRLRAYAFDPSLATRSSDAAINEIIIPVVFEPDLKPGPVGDYLEVVDIDPASDCVYAPVDLNHPYLLAQDGLLRSEGNPQFHQQMVYAVAMKTIGHFEEALGRPLFWSPLRPWDWRSGDDDRHEIRPKMENGEPVLNRSGKPVQDESDQFVQRLRLYPHALRDQNAYYSPQKRAILFGYFPAGDSDPGMEYPGGVVFTCLAHDIIAHEMTHAILDGMHVSFIEATNPDVHAFHEAFADIVALFQRFSYPELLKSQIARARGRLDAGTLMTRLALQFGQATGRHQALRDALGHVVRQARQKGTGEWRDRRDPDEMNGSSEPRTTIADAARDLSDDEARFLWKRFHADPLLVASVMEPHDRGSFLVAAVFDAYLCIYEDRIADLKRIATGGTGVLPDGELHPDLVNRMADEAAKSARHVLRMCIRAMDYVPPTDITFGEFLRALITADTDLVPNDDRRYRVAFIEAFRKWGIYPRDVRTLSEETLRWAPPGELPDLPWANCLRPIKEALLNWQPGQPREAIFNTLHQAYRLMHRYFRELPDDPRKNALLGGVDTRRSFQVTNLRPARRVGLRGEFRTEMVVEVGQRSDAQLYDEDERREETIRKRRANAERRDRGEEDEPNEIPFRGGVTLVISLDTFTVRYAIYKRMDSEPRAARQREFVLGAGGGKSSDAAEYSSENLPLGWYSNPEIRARWLEERMAEREAMRASSCACRRKKMTESELKAANKAKREGFPVQDSLKEPFALLHRS